MRYKLRIYILTIVLILPSTYVMADKNNSYTNRLIEEKSPYLLQHAHNPVDWYPWGEEAFKKAKKENKPIFLSIGYSTCHWCHVMEKESFSNPEIAEILNKYFVSIKVDREERPDIDNIFMNAVVTLTGRGGWPLTVFLTPDKQPFFGGTYFPAEDKFGRPGLKNILVSIANAWVNRKDEILGASKSLIRAIQKQAAFRSKEVFSLNEITLKKAFTGFSGRFDPKSGGFGPAPKFPMGHSLSFLLGYWKRSGEQEAIDMVEKTLTAMLRGGIYDHIGGGFHRYSTDSQWRIPHFEKMIYDQAVLSRTYLEAYQATGKEKYAEAARQIFTYVLRNMTHSEGGFYSAEDADSPDPQNTEEKKEGAFYVWRADEITHILGKKDAEIFSYAFGIEPDGNALDDPLGEFKGKNILYLLHTTEETALKFQKSPDEIKKIIKHSKDKLFAARKKRPRPYLDDKILVNWNGLMISSLALGSRVLNNPGYRQAAEKAAQFILEKLIDKNGRLLHRYREGEAGIPGTIEDYAFFIHGLYDLYEASFNIRYLKESKHLTREMLRFFWDNADGGFFFTAHDAEKLLLRQKEIYDGAIPSGNAIALLDLIRIGRLTIEKDFESKAEELLKAFSGKITRLPRSFTQILISLDFVLGPSKEIIIAGERDSRDTEEMTRRIYKRFIPNKVVAFRPSSGKESEMVIRLIPFLKDQVALHGKATAYVCINYVCKFPTNSIEKLDALLDE